jgi:hypothetical protein
MRRHVFAGLRVLFFALLALVAGGCTVESRYMAKVESPHAVGPNSATATVVFVRPSNYAGRLRTVIMDQSGRFLGECWGKTYFAVTMPPGHYQFISWGEGTPALDATVEAGRVYYVEVGTVIGAWTARARLFGVGPGRKAWPELASWLGKSTMLIPDEAAGQTYLRERGPDVQNVIEKARGSWDEYDAEDRAKRSIGPADGVPGLVQPRFE